ncbi:MAG: isoamylase early set domain-containing protein [Actinomycetota bacterium]|nr:isoamylase early set domain-containing protein [Actinomycetota bacterium]
MLRKSKPKSDVAKITFAVPADRSTAVSVVGEFNEWDPSAHPLRKRSNGTRSVTIELPVGRSWEYLYVTTDGAFVADPDAELHVPNPYGGSNSVLTT